MYLEPSRYYMLLQHSREYTALLKWWEPVSLILGTFALILCITWAIMAVKLLARNQFLEERSQILIGLLVKHGEDRELLERMLDIPAKGTIFPSWKPQTERKRK